MRAKQEGETGKLQNEGALSPRIGAWGYPRKHAGTLRTGMFLFRAAGVELGLGLGFSAFWGSRD